MKRDLTESIIIFFSIVKWLALASFTGVLVGSSTAFFLKFLDLGTSLTMNHKFYFLFLPLGLFLSSYIIHKFAPDAEGHGTERVIEAIHKTSGHISVKVIPVKLIATIITLVSGGSAGKEGPSAQIGAGLASLFAGIMKFNDIDRRKIVICGISAGFSAVFGTPIAGAIFAIEVLSIGKILYDVMLPSIIAGVIGYEISSFLGVPHFHTDIIFHTPFTLKLFSETILAGLFFGLISLLLIETLGLFKELSARIKIWTPYKGIIGGISLIIFSLIFSNRYIGLGVVTISETLQDKPIAWYGFIVKILTTSITLNFGGSGGILTPVFFIGATAGAFFANLFSLPGGIFAAIGVVALLSGAANTPIAACIMAMEMFGNDITGYAAVACVISFMMSGHRSVYPSQKISFTKSSSINIETETEIELVNPSFIPKSKLFAKLVETFNETQKK
jgi:H+/Cl- antiporter ClcA